MFKKVLIVLMIGCFLLGMATKAEVEGVKEEAESTKNEPNENLNEGEVSLELMGEKELNTETKIEMAIAEGKRIAKGDEGEVVFFNNKKELVKRIKIEYHRGWWGFSENKKYAGGYFGPKQGGVENPEDSFTLYDSLGDKIWSITREEDKGTIFHSRVGFGGMRMSFGDIKISNDGSRLAVVEGFSKQNFSPDSSLRIAFYNEKGGVIKEAIIPHLYYLQASWTPDGEKFVVSVPGDNALDVSKDDLIYAFDKNGNVAWKYVARGIHLSSVGWRDHQTLIVTNLRVLHAYPEGFILLDNRGKIIFTKKLEPPASCNFRVSPNKEYVVGSSRTWVFLVSLSQGEVLWRWEWKDKGWEPLIRDGYFSPDSRLIAVSGSSDKDKGTVFLFNTLEGFKEKIEMEGSVDRYGRSLEVYFSGNQSLGVCSILRKELYRINIIGR